jgi:hypothetical protein
MIFYLSFEHRWGIAHSRYVLNPIVRTIKPGASEGIVERSPCTRTLAPLLVQGMMRRAIMLNVLPVKNTSPRTRTVSPLLRGGGKL